MRYVTSIRFARFEDGKIVNYNPGKEIELSDKEAERFAAGTLKPASPQQQTEPLEIKPGETVSALDAFSIRPRLTKK